VAVATALNAAFQFALARILEPAEYSLLAALFTVVLISQVPTLGLQASVAREIAARLADGDRQAAGRVLRSTLRAALVAAAAIVVLAVLAFGALAAAEGTRRSLPVFVTAATIALGLAVP